MKHVPSYVQKCLQLPYVWCFHGAADTPTLIHFCTNPAKVDICLFFAAYIIGIFNVSVPFGVVNKWKAAFTKTITRILVALEAMR